MKLKNKIILKGIFHSLLQLLLTFTFAWFNDCIFEMIIIYICFFYFRSKFQKQFHAKTTWLCTLYSIIVYFIVSNISPNKETGLVLIIGFTFFINLISFHIREYLDLKDRFKAKKIEIKKGMNKEELLRICNQNFLTELETNILIYFYCDRYSITKTSHKLDYSYDYICELKSRIIKKIKLNNI